MPKYIALSERERELLRLNHVCTLEELSEGWSNDIRFDLKELVDEHGNIKNPKDLSPKTRRLLQGFKVKESVIEADDESDVSVRIINRYIEYKLPDRQKARIELGKRLGYYPAEEVKHTGNVTLTIEGLDD